MSRPRMTTFGLCGVLLIAPMALGADMAANKPQAKTKVQYITDFLAKHPNNGLNHSADGRIERVYGPAFAQGASPEVSAKKFVDEFAGMWGVTPEQLRPVGSFPDGRHIQPIMYQPETGTYKFTGVFYTQAVNGIPVFRTALRLLTRNEANYPLVLASADLRDLGNFQVDGALAAAPKVELAMAQATKAFLDQPQFTDAELVIWAGVDEFNAPPTLAVQFTGEAGNPLIGSYDKILFIADAATGEILYQESQVHNVDVVGNVSALATDGIGADACHPEVSTPMPYAEVSIGGNVAYADVNGNFVIPNGGAGQVTVNAAIRGPYFFVNNVAGAETTLSQIVTPPGPANFLFNAANNSEHQRAEVNAYIHANIVRDFILTYNPAYPAISTQSDFPVNVNINLNCNAFYDGSSINFYVAGGGCTNTASSTVVYHEYGHHLVQSGGSGQGAYGEGMSDVLAVLVTDQPCLGLGFSGSCGSCLRNAQNSCNYVTSGCSTCGSAAHTCGQLISGCVWNTRNALAATHPATYRDILSSLAINAVLLHNGSSITPSITVDYLTLDDDDGDIGNGTPHYNEINQGFGSHNMPAPPLSALAIAYPDGRPEFVSPDGSTTMRVVVSGIAGTPQPGTGKLHVNTGSGFVAINMTETSPNQYEAVFPAITCGEPISYYVSAMTTTNQTVTSPSNAPASTFTALGGTGFGEIAFDDDFEADQGWTVTNSAGLTSGAWERGVPNAAQAAPGADADGSGQCFVTGNAIVPFPGNNDIDGGSTTLTSPVMNADYEAAVVSYWRWYSNTSGAAPQADVFVVEISDDAGATWINLETVGPTTNSPNPEVEGGWVHKTYDLVGIPGFELNNQFRIRFTASDLNAGSYVEAAVDGVRVQAVNCIDGCPADVNNSGGVDVADLLLVINSWGPCSGCPADINNNGNVGVEDLLAVVNGWGTCP